MGIKGNPSSKLIDVALAIVIRDRRVLIAKRPPGGVLGGFWEFPGGKIETGESPRDAAVRETREELGLDVIALEQWSPIIHRYTYATVNLTPILCQACPGEPRAIACSAWNWVSADGLAEFPFPDANAHLLTDVARWLRLQTLA